jgi:hypothetical protein
MASGVTSEHRGVLQEDALWSILYSKSDQRFGSNMQQFPFTSPAIPRYTLASSAGVVSTSFLLPDLFSSSLVELKPAIRRCRQTCSHFAPWDLGNEVPPQNDPGLRAGCGDW